MIRNTKEQQYDGVSDPAKVLTWRFSHSCLAEVSSADITSRLFFGRSAAASIFSRASATLDSDAWVGVQTPPPCGCGVVCFFPNSFDCTHFGQHGVRFS